MAGALCDLYEDGQWRRWYLQSCPWALLESPDVREVSEAHRWWKQGQLIIRYPNPPAVLLRAIDDFESGSNRGQHDKFERNKNRQAAAVAAERAKSSNR
jgi:hypothetical protein